MDKEKELESFKKQQEKLADESLKQKHDKDNKDESKPPTKRAFGTTDVKDDLQSPQKKDDAENSPQKGSLQGEERNKLEKGKGNPLSQQEHNSPSTSPSIEKKDRFGDSERKADVGNKYERDDKNQRDDYKAYGRETSPSMAMQEVSSNRLQFELLNHYNMEATRTKLELENIWTIMNDMKEHKRVRDEQERRNYESYQQAQVNNLTGILWTF